MGEGTNIDPAAVARRLGAAAFAAGCVRVPAQDAGVMDLIWAHVPAGMFRPALSILDGWLWGWDAANLAAPVDLLGADHG